MKRANAIINILKRGSLFASGGLTFLFRIGGLALNFLVMLAITNWYGDEIYGSYSLAFTLAQATGLLFAMGFPNALVSYLGLKSITHAFSQHLLRKGLKFLVPLSFVPMLIFFAGADAIAQHIFGNENLAVYLKIVAVTVPVMILHEYFLYFFIATGNFVKFNIFMFIVPNAVLLLLLLCIKDVEGHYTFIFYFLSILAVLLIEAFYALKKSNDEEYEKIPIREMVKYASPMMFSGLMLYLLNWTDIFMLGAMVNESRVGQYNGAYKIASLGMLVITSMNVVLAPRIASLYNEGDYSNMHKAVKKTTYLIIMLTLPLIGCIILFSEFLLSLLGNDFVQAKTALVIIAVGIMMNAITGTVDQILNMTGNQKLLRNITIIGFGLNFTLNLFLIPYYGIEGAALASLATNIVFNFTCVFYIKKKLGFYTFA